MKLDKLYRFLKKRNKSVKVKPKKILHTKAWNYDEVKPELQSLYDCSIQKTAADFKLANIDVNNNLVTVAMDEADDYSQLQETVNTVYQMQAQGQEIIFTYFAKQGFIGFNNCSILAQDWLIHKAIVAPCDDAISINYDVTVNSEDVTDETQNLLTEMKTMSDDTDSFDIKTVCNMFAQNKRKYGQSICVPLIDGLDYSQPFNIDAVEKGSYRGMAVIEPVWIAPVLDADALTNPLSKRFYQPTWFRLPNGTMVHHSWCVFNTYGVPSDILKPTYYFGGIPLPQLLYEQVYAAHKTAKEAPMLAQSKRLNYVEGQPEALLFDDEQRNTLDFISWIRNNFGFLLIKPDQKIGQLDTSLTDFDAVTMLTYQLVAAISGVISTRLLETSPKGWQSSGGYEEKQYRKLQQSIQRIDFCPILDLHYRLLAKSKYGLTERYVIDFEEIDTPTAKEAAEIRSINAQTDTAYINAGVISPEEVRMVLKEDEESGYNALEDLPDDVEYNDIEGGSETSQDPFQ